MEDKPTQPKQSFADAFAEATESLNGSGFGGRAQDLMRKILIDHAEECEAIKAEMREEFKLLAKMYGEEASALEVVDNALAGAVEEFLGILLLIESVRVGGMTHFLTAATTLEPLVGTMGAKLRRGEVEEHPCDVKTFRKQENAVNADLSRLVGGSQLIH